MSIATRIRSGAISARDPKFADLCAANLPAEDAEAFCRPHPKAMRALRRIQARNTSTAGQK